MLACCLSVLAFLLLAFVPPTRLSSGLYVCSSRNCNGVLWQSWTKGIMGLQPWYQSGLHGNATPSTSMKRLYFCTAANEG